MTGRLAKKMWRHCGRCLPGFCGLVTSPTVLDELADGIPGHSAKMSYRIIKDKLDNGEIVLLDGGTGSEIERLGVQMNDLAWCGIAHVEQPEVVRRVHESYIRAGADIIIANTFGTAPHIIKRLGLEEQAMAINQSAVRLALQARDNCDSDVCIAVSMSSMPAFDQFYIPVNDEVRTGFMRQAEWLAAAGAELIIAEMMRDMDICDMVIAAARATGLPVWTGFSVSKNAAGSLIGYESPVRSDEAAPFRQLAEAVLAMGCDAAGVMHSSVHDTAPALAELGALWDGPMFAYAETGHFVPPNWKFEDIISPQDYLRYSRQWLSQGAQIIGGCCGIGPEHIRELNEKLTG